MSKQHLTSFRVENFKRFDSLELTDIGQFNLIVGDNNVGKTSVLEALLFDFDRKKCLLNLHKTLLLKGLNIRPKMVYGPKGEVLEVLYPDENFLRYLLKKLDIYLSFSIKTPDEESQGAIINLGMSPPPIGAEDGPEFYSEGEEVSFAAYAPDNRYIKFKYSELYDFPYENHPEHGERGGQHLIKEVEIAGLYEHLLSQNINQWELPFISTSLPSNGTLPKSYFEQVNLSRKEKKQLIEDMQFLLPEIEDFEVRKIGGEDHLLVGMQGKDELMPISIFGESVTRATQILLEISKHKGKRLMIDEIDTGIHYSRMKRFLKTIFQVADKNEVQLFMTTHSLECQEAFAEVFEEPDMVQHQAKARQFTLIENADGQIEAVKRDMEQLEFALETNNDTRGGKWPW